MEWTGECQKADFLWDWTHVPNRKTDTTSNHESERDDVIHPIPLQDSKKKENFHASREWWETVCPGFRHSGHYSNECRDGAFAFSSVLFRVYSALFRYP
ncbi:MAG: hypothetical protein CVV34_03215 [Methanomicrobiales archaeon HGW-Methanomicrobiales-5]|nr:MAG: hypothetical protein CVV34_03215 [Methanomicrobiales archaeon HGW-Methanomicrobiales-5]